MKHNFLAARSAKRREERLGDIGVRDDLGGNGEFRSMLCKDRGCVYGGVNVWDPVVARLRGARGDINGAFSADRALNGDGLVADSSDGRADVGGVKVY